MSDEQRISEAELHAYADGLVDEARRAQIDAWLAERPEEAERVASWKRVDEDLRALFDPVLAEPVPEPLLRAAQDAAPRGRVRWRAAALAASWAVLGAALGGLAG